MILEKPTKNKNEKEMVNINDVLQYSNEKKWIKMIIAWLRTTSIYHWY